MGRTSKKTKKRAADGRFKAFVQSQEPTEGTLPLTHITRAYDFEEILEEEALQPETCVEFKEKLIYLFYGRPAYRAKQGCNGRLQYEWPIVFVFRPERIETIKRVFPFDSGAFKRQLYAEFFPKNSKINDFEVPPSLESARKLVRIFFSSNHGYFYGEVKTNLDLHRQYEAQGVAEMAMLPGGEGRDERSSAIEIQTNKPITLKDALLAILLPQMFFDDPEIKDAVARWNVEHIEPYTVIHNMGKDGVVGGFYTRVEDLYRRLGFLHSNA